MIKIHELLDRLEILYPDSKVIPDLRRAYFDKDFFSIFRLIESERTLAGDIQDLRKATTQDNFYSLFDLIDKTENDLELEKLIRADNINSLWKILDNHDIHSQILVALRNFQLRHIEINLDCLARGQLKSKKWLVDELSKLVEHTGTIFLCGGWYGTLATMLFESDISVEKIRSFDIDPETPDIAKEFNKPWLIDGWKFLPIIDDMYKINYDKHTYQVVNSKGEKNTLEDSPDTIINTSCEHIPDFTSWYNRIPKDRLVILQSNNYFEVEDHVNCSETLADFQRSAPMTNLLYSGELELDGYTRFMLIGIR